MTCNHEAPIVVSTYCATGFGDMRGRAVSEPLRASGADNGGGLRC